MARMDLLDALERVYACDEAKTWLREERVRKPDALKSQERWDACERGDWLLWLAAKANIDRKALVMAACACARLALKFIPAGETRPLAAIETAERWCRGEATLAEVMAARDACWRCAASYAAYAADAASAAAADAAYAADAASAAAADAADAAYAAAYAAADAATAAAAAAAAAFAPALAAADSRSEMRKACANEVRKRVKWSDVERGLFLAAGGVL